MTSDHASKIAKNMKEMTIVNRGGRRNKLTQNLDMIGYIGASDSKIDKTSNKMTIACRSRERITIRRTKLDIELHRSLNIALIAKSYTIKKILDIPFLGDKKSIESGGNLNPKKVAKRIKIRHKKMLTKMGLNKSNVLVIASDDHVTNIEKEKSSHMRRRVNKKHGIMSTRRETNNSHRRGETLKPGTRGLFQTIKRAPKMTNHAIRNRVPSRRQHVNLLTQLSIEKSVLNIHLTETSGEHRLRQEECAMWSYGP
jgi:hypothetical protein